MRRALSIGGHYRDRTALLNQCYRRIVPCFYRKPAKLVTDLPIISFTFDDFPLSAYTAGAPILEQFGARGTYYVCLDPRLTQEPEFSGAQADAIVQLVERGHEIGCHTFSHLDGGVNGELAIRETIAQNRAALARIVPEYRLCSFAYPFGNVSIQAKNVAGGLFESARGIASGINVGVIDLAQLRAHELRERRQSLFYAQQLIERNRQKKGWLIFFTHEVAVNPGVYGLTAASFRKVVEMAVASGAVLTTVVGAMASVIRGVDG